MSEPTDRHMVERQASLDLDTLLAAWIERHDLSYAEGAKLLNAKQARWLDFVVRHERGEA